MNQTVSKLTATELRMNPAALADQTMKELYTCRECHTALSAEDALPAGKGEEESICHDCSLDKCYQCGWRECEVEIRGGEYVCSECYSHFCSNAYDYYRDND